MVPYLALDDRFPSNPKVAGLSDRAFRLHVVALCHCATQLTDGLVRDSAKLWANIGGNIRSYTRITSELCLAGLWVKVDGGFRIHDYLDWNASAAQIKEKRRKDRARKRGKVFDDSERNPDGNNAPFRVDSTGTASKKYLRTSSTPASNEAAGVAVDDRLAKVAANAQTVLDNTGDVERALSFIDNQPRLTTDERGWLEDQILHNWQQIRASHG
jgi:hypothetical protein